MYKFDETTLFSGYIKQLLASFNLPKFRVYTRQQAKYASNYLKAKNNLTCKLAILNSKYPNPEDEKEEKNRLTSMINSLENSPSELNVIPTIYRNKYNVYPQSTGGSAALTRITYVPYIKDGVYQEYSLTPDGSYKWTKCHAEFIDSSHEEHVHGKDSLYQIKRFAYDKYDKNYTNTLEIRNNHYDSYTHEYLGNYLRFQRDYNLLDLMSLYNCFSNRACDNLSLKIKLSATDSVEFNTSDKNYKIYMVPVKLFQEYTIALTCETEVEMFCGVYGSYYDTDTSITDLPVITYTKYNNLLFSKPVLFKGLSDLSMLSESTISKLAQKERDLKLFIKLPVSNESSITILEGNYVGYNDSIWTCPKVNTWEKKQNHSITNFEYDEALINFKPISQLQLLMADTKESYPFADKLVEYLLGNTITHLDPIGDNIKRVKTVVDKYVDHKKMLFEVDELWSSELRPILYNYMTRLNDVPFSLNHDLLGYVDKATEQLFSYTEKDAVTKEVIDAYSIATVDIYEGEYNG